MLRIAVILVILLLLPGCTKLTTPENTLLLVPTAPPKITFKPMLRLPIKDLTETSSPDQVLKAFVESLDIQRDYIVYLKSRRDN